MNHEDYIHIKNKEYEAYKDHPEILKGLEEERAKEGIFLLEEKTTGRKSKYLYTTKEEQFRNRPEVLEAIDMERALSHDGITYKTPEEEQELIKKKKIRQKKLKLIMDLVIDTIKPKYCEEKESAELVNPNNNVTFNPQFVEMAKDMLINSTFYSTGNSGKFGNNFVKIEKILDSLRG